MPFHKLVLLEIILQSTHGIFEFHVALLCKIYSILKLLNFIFKLLEFPSAMTVTLMSLRPLMPLRP